MDELWINELAQRHGLRLSRHPNSGDPERQIGLNTFELVSDDVAAAEAAMAEIREVLLPTQQHRAVMSSVGDSKVIRIYDVWHH